MTISCYLFIYFAPKYLCHRLTDHTWDKTSVLKEKQIQAYDHFFWHIKGHVCVHACACMYVYKWAFVYFHYRKGTLTNRHLGAYRKPRIWRVNNKRLKHHLIKHRRRKPESVGLRQVCRRRIPDAPPPGPSRRSYPLILWPDLRPPSNPPSVNVEDGLFGEQSEQRDGQPRS